MLDIATSLIHAHYIEVVLLVESGLGLIVAIWASVSAWGDHRRMIRAGDNGDNIRTSRGAVRREIVISLVQLLFFYSALGIIWVETPGQSEVKLPATALIVRKVMILSSLILLFLSIIERWDRMVLIENARLKRRRREDKIKDMVVQEERRERSKGRRIDDQSGSIFYRRRDD